MGFGIGDSESEQRRYKAITKSSTEWFQERLGSDFPVEEGLEIMKYITLLQK